MVLKLELHIYTDILKVVVRISLKKEDRCSCPVKLMIFFNHPISNLIQSCVATLSHYFLSILRYRFSVIDTRFCEPAMRSLNPTYKYVKPQTFKMIGLAQTRIILTWIIFINLCQNPNLFEVNIIFTVQRRRGHT
jgi:hypothetical protein